MTMLSLCMICRDNARTIGPCLESIRPWVDEMIVVDTGSKDETPRLAEECGAKVFRFAWCDDFAKARNESLRHARGQWLFWMDSDDTIDPNNGRKLRDLAYKAHNPRTVGFVMQVHCPGGNSDDGCDLTVVDHVMMFRNQPQIRFEFRIHEQIIPSIRRLGGNVAWSDVFVVHSGADLSSAGQRQKLDRDLKLLNIELAERGEHPFVLFNLGMTYSFMGDHEHAIHFLERSLRVSDPSESQVRKVYALFVASLFQLQRVDEAVKIGELGLRQFPSDPELLFRMGILAHHRGSFVEAEQAYLRVLEKREDRHFSSVDPGITGFKTRHNLAQVYADMGRLDLAEVQWRHAVDAAPTFFPARRGLVENNRRQGKLITAQVESERIENDHRKC